MSKNHSKSRKKMKKGKGKARNLMSERGLTTTVIPSSIGWASRRLRVTLRYSASGTITNAGNTYANRRYEPTYAYDIDPALGSTAMPGFAEYGAIYRLYRVRSSHIRVTYANLEAFPVVFCICPANTDPGSNTASYQNYFSSTLARTKAVGPLTGNSAGVLSHACSTNVIGGVKDVQQLDTYCGSTNGGTVPTNNWWWFVGVLGFANFTTAGCGIQADVSVEIEFFELLNPST